MGKDYRESTTVSQQPDAALNEENVPLCALATSTGCIAIKNVPFSDVTGERRIGQDHVETGVSSPSPPTHVLNRERAVQRIATGSLATQPKEPAHVRSEQAIQADEIRAAIASNQH
ncbi:MAG: hypothetical protein OXK77_00020 [Gemmatimonadota bacterium]|nr:hypothetical protein [Gemmatimonadota bacterium]MDE2865294.1 hypothetical protein [Gemmatimonadota bacterium]